MGIEMRIFLDTNVFLAILNEEEIAEEVRFHIFSDMLIYFKEAYYDFNWETKALNCFFKNPYVGCKRRDPF
jgi:hypothetical protein